MMTSEFITEAEKFGLEADVSFCQMMRYLLPYLFCVMIFRYAKTVVRICYGREGWQAVRSAGLGSIGVCGTCFRRPLGLPLIRSAFIFVLFKITLQKYNFS